MVILLKKYKTMSMVVDTLTVSLNFQTLKYKIKGNEFSRLKGYLTCRLRIPSEVRTYISKLGKVRNFLQRLVRKLTGDYDDNHELPAMNLGMIAVALPEIVGHNTFIFILNVFNKCEIR